MYDKIVKKDKNGPFFARAYVKRTKVIVLKCSRQKIKSFIILNRTFLLYRLGEKIRDRKRGYQSLAPLSPVYGPDI